MWWVGARFWKISVKGDEHSSCGKNSRPVALTMETFSMHWETHTCTNFVLQPLCTSTNDANPETVRRILRAIHSTAQRLWESRQCEIQGKGGPYIYFLFFLCSNTSRLIVKLHSYLVDSDINMKGPNYFSSSYCPCFSRSFHLPSSAGYPGLIY